MLVVRGRRKEGASGENGGARVLWRWHVAELWLAQPVAVAHGEVGAWEEGGGRCRLEERDRREEREGEGRRKRGKEERRADRWGHRHVVSNSAKPPCKTALWPNMNFFESRMAANVRF
jgi:hypothetical protein